MLSKYKYVIILIGFSIILIGSGFIIAYMQYKGITDPSFTLICAAFIAIIAGIIRLTI